MPISQYLRKIVPLQKYFHAAAIISAALAVACNSSPGSMEYSQIGKDAGARAKMTCGPCSVIFPPEWKPADKGGSGKAGLMEMARKKGNETASCLVACETVSPGKALNDYMREKFTKITAQMIRSGFGVTSIKDDLIGEIASSKKTGSVDLSGFAYELKAPPQLKNRRVLAVALFAKKSNSILTLTFEMGPKAYVTIKKELKDIVSSLL